MITLKGLQCSQGFQWGQWFSGRADRRADACLTLPQVWNLREGCDRQIDALVYGLYGLMGEEIGVVEERTAH